MFKFLSGIPRGDVFHFFLQKHFTRSLPISDDVFFDKVRIGLKHLSSFQNVRGDLPLEELSALEFGAGWELVGPFLNAALGMRHQTIVDIKTLVRIELLRDTLSKMKRHREEIEHLANRKFTQEFLEYLKSSPKDLASLSTIGIRYVVPVDLRNAPFDSSSFDLILNSSTLEHIPRESIVQILNGCHRILRPDGILSCVIDLTDHYAHSDPTLTYYNFLKYSEADWQWYNSALQYQNRLRARDYLEMFRSAGFTVVARDQYIGRENEAAMLVSLPLAQEFRNRYSREELEITRLDAILQKDSHK